MAVLRQASAPASLQGQPGSNCNNIWADHEEGVDSENFDENSPRIASAGSALRAVRSAKASLAPEAAVSVRVSPSTAQSPRRRRTFATIDGTSDVATFVFRLADAARQSLVVDHDFSTGGACPLIDALPPRTQLVVIQRSLAALLRQPSDTPLPASLFLEAPIYALVMHLLPLIEAEIEEQGDSSLADPRRGSSQRQHRQRRGDDGKSGENDDDEANDSEGDEDWCQQRCFALALYELSTAGAVPVRRDCSDLKLWRSLLAEAVGALLAAPPALVSSLGSQDGPLAALEAVGLDGQALDLYVCDVKWGDDRDGTSRGLGVPLTEVDPEEVRWANLWIAALCWEDTNEAFFFTHPRQGGKGGGSNNEEADIASLGEAVTLFIEAEKSATEAQHSADDLERAAHDAISTAVGRPSSKLEEKFARAQAKAAETKALRAEQCGNLTRALALYLQLLAHQVNKKKSRNHNSYPYQLIIHELLHCPTVLVSSRFRNGSITLLSLKSSPLICPRS